MGTRATTEELDDVIDLVVDEERGAPGSEDGSHSADTTADVAAGAGTDAPSPDVHESADDAPSDDHREAIGARLRSIRHQQGMSLADVQERSNGTWKAVVVGAYERGDRAVTISRMSDLADFYGVPLIDLLPDVVTGGSGEEDETRVVIDLERMQYHADNTDDDDLAITALVRFTERIRRLRGDYNGQVLTIRGSDLPAIAAAIGEDPATLLAEYRTLGILRP